MLLQSFATRRQSARVTKKFLDSTDSSGRNNDDSNDDENKEKGASPGLEMGCPFKDFSDLI